MTARRLPRGIRHRRLPSGAYVWEVTLSYHGRRVRKQLGPIDALSLRDVVEKRNLMVADAIRDIESLKAPRLAATLGRLRDEYLAAVPAGTVRYERSEMHLRHLTAHLGETLPLDRLTMARLVNYRTRRSSVRPSTVNRELSTLRAALNWAKRHAPALGVRGHLFDNLGSGDRRAIFAPEARSQAPARLSDEVLHEICAHLPKPFHPLVWMAVETGLRKKELMGLDWSQVHATDHPPYVTVVGKGTKSRVTLLSNRALAALPSKRWRQGPVWRGARGRPINNWTRAWGIARERAGHPWVRIHDLRHEWASRFVERGGDLRALMEMGGWSALELVERYTRANLGHALDVLNRRSTS